MSTRTPELVRLEAALAKAHYYDAATLEEANTRYARLAEVEAELRDLDGGGCEHAGAER